MEEELNGTATVESSEGFDMATALSDMAEGMGFEASEDSDAQPAKGTDSESAEPAASVEKTSAEAQPVMEAPKTWRPEAAAEWSKLPPTVQAEVLKREADIFKGIEQYKEAANFGQSFKQILDPYLPILQQYGLDPVHHIQSLMEVNKVLAFGSEQEKTALFQELMTAYGVDPNNITIPYQDPQIVSLQKEIEALKLAQVRAQQAETQRVYQKTEAEVSAFASDPAHPYFDEVANDIATLLKSGVATTLADAYEKAVWANPVTRAKEQARITTEAQEKAKAEAGKARGATAANVRMNSKPAGGTARVGSLDDTLMETLASIKSRT